MGSQEERRKWSGFVSVSSQPVGPVDNKYFQIDINITLITELIDILFIFLNWCGDNQS